MFAFSARTLVLASAFALSTQSSAAESLTCLVEAQPPGVQIAEWRKIAAAGLAEGTVSEVTVAKRIQECFGAQVPLCLQRTLDYSKRDELASASADVTAAQSAEKRPPVEFLNDGASEAELTYALPANIEEVAAARGWPAVRYKSRHSGGFDFGTPSLLMVYVPGDKVDPPVGYDRWLNFALPADSGDDALTPLPQAPVPVLADYAAELTGGIGLPRTFTMVTLTRKQPGAASAPAQVWFQKFYRGGTGSPIFRPESTSDLNTCVSCHPNGLRAISPLGYHVREGEAQLPEAAWKQVELINEAMNSAAGFKGVRWREAIVDAATGATRPLLTPMAQGPVVGPTKPLTGGTTRSKAFIEGCIERRKKIYVTDIFGRAPGAKNIYELSAQPAVDWEKVRDAMSCASCHNDKSRGALTRDTSWDQIDFKILVDQSMPLGLHQNPLEQGSADAAVVDELTSDERIALSNCLQAEFQLERQELAAWLTQTSCGE